jgi:hypothetical protein
MGHTLCCAAADSTQSGTHTVLNNRMFRSFFRSLQLLSCSTHSPVHHRVHSSTSLVHAMSHINQSTLFNPTPLRSILIVSSHLHLGFQGCLFPHLFSNQILVYISCACYKSRLSHPQLHQPNNISVHTTHPAVFSIPLLRTRQADISTTTPALPIPVHLNCITFALAAALRDTFQNTLRISIAICRSELRLPRATDV